MTFERKLDILASILFALLTFAASAMIFEVSVEIAAFVSVIAFVFGLAFGREFVEAIVRLL